MAHTDGATNAMEWGALHGCPAVQRGEEPVIAWSDSALVLWIRPRHTRRLMDV